MFCLKCSQISKVVLLSVFILANTITPSLSAPSRRIQEGVEVVLETTVYFYSMFAQCMQSAMPSKKYALDDLKTYVNYPSITTVGYAPRFTSNRKFFANMLNSPEFKSVLAADERQLKENMVMKMKYCDSVVMDEQLIKFMYDREVDQTKL
ncbi:hypothetical protein PYW08_001560 [Mythimna loreyi]|uniref:Uncharacterized protein n=1 Tax=Mythimna loreyi TaxID=667449 RepID=A0ACC2R4E4_9NEOP|nr:hypothetical protein PYW08_001560 [Mythimna loreyi]